LTDKVESRYYGRLLRVVMSMIIDAFAFCRQEEQRSGKLPISQSARLKAECVSDEGEIEWQLAGGMSSPSNGHPVMRLTVQGTVQLKCQRCLAPYVFSVQSESTLFLAQDEQEADQLDAFLLAEELADLAEVIVGSATCDIQALVEDEALLMLPLSPKHTTCPGQETGHPQNDEDKQGGDNQKKQSPFAILTGLKDQLASSKSKK
jgi:uncharacterized protein